MASRESALKQLECPGLNDSAANDPDSFEEQYPINGRRRNAVTDCSDVQEKIYNKPDEYECAKVVAQNACVPNDNGYFSWSEDVYDDDGRNANSKEDKNSPCKGKIKAKNVPEELICYIQSFEASEYYKKKVQPLIDSGQHVVMHVRYHVVGKKGYEEADIILNEGKDGADRYVVHILLEQVGITPHGKYFAVSYQPPLIQKEGRYNAPLFIPPIDVLQLIPFLTFQNTYTPEPVSVPDIRFGHHHVHIHPITIAQGVTPWTSRMSQEAFLMTFRINNLWGKFALSRIRIVVNVGSNMNSQLNNVIPKGCEVVNEKTKRTQTTAPGKTIMRNFTNSNTMRQNIEAQWNEFGNQLQRLMGIPVNVIFNYNAANINVQVNVQGQP